MRDGQKRKWLLTWVVTMLTTNGRTFFGFIHNQISLMHPDVFSTVCLGAVLAVLLFLNPKE